MNRLHSIRKAYDDNYRKMREIIQQMGGDQQIKFHRRQKTALYRELRKLQQREHYLDQLENRLAHAKSMVS